MPTPEEKKVQEEEALGIPPPDKVDDSNKPPEGYTEEEWRDLSPTEKEGILESINKPEGEEEGTEEGLSEEELAKIAGTGEQPKDEEPKAAAAETPAPPAKAGEPAVIVVTDEELLTFRPSIDENKLTEMVAAQLPAEEIPEELKTKLAEIEQKYEDGDMRLTEYNRERDAINRQIILDSSRKQEEVRGNIRQDLIWRAEQAKFFQARPEYEYKPDGSVKGKALYGALNETIKALDSDPANAGISGIQLLVKADRLVKEAFGSPSPSPAIPKPVAKPPARVPTVKSLADVPAAGVNDTDGAWGGLDRLHGQAYEDALERLTPEQRERYLAAR